MKRVLKFICEIKIMIMLIRCCDDQDILHLDNIDIMFASNKLALENIHHLI